MSNGQLPESPMKPGVRTSEFGTLAAYAVLVAVNARLGIGISDEVLMALGGVVAAYIAQRGWAKR